MNATVTLEDLRQLRCAEPCAGAGGLTSALEAQGFQTVWLSEINGYCRRLLRHHFPDAKVYGDLLELVGRGKALVRKHGRPLLYSGGTPCQDLSVAGGRAGLRGSQSGLFYAFMELWSELGSPLCLWENVPGALSSHGGKDFARVLGAFVGKRFAVPRVGRRGDRVRWARAGVITGPAGVAAWRILDAQYFGVPQRRRRLFVLGTRSGLFDPGAILLDPEGVRGDSQEGSQAWKEVAARLGDGAPTARLRLDGLTGHARGDDRTSGASREAPEVDRPDDGSVPVAFRKSGRAHTTDDGETWVVADVSPTLNAHDLEGSDVRTTAAIVQAIADPVSANEARTYTHEGKTGLRTIPRRLMPLECERLQGWRDGWTNVPKRTIIEVSDAGLMEVRYDYPSDSKRYRAIGNGVAKPVAQWIAWRIRLAVIEAYLTLAGAEQ